MAESQTHTSSQDQGEPVHRRHPLDRMPIVVLLGLVFGALMVSGATLVISAAMSLSLADERFVEPGTIWQLIGGIVLALICLGLFSWLAVHLRDKPSRNFHIKSPGA